MFMFTDNTNPLDLNTYEGIRERIKSWWDMYYDAFPRERNGGNRYYDLFFPNEKHNAMVWKRYIEERIEKLYEAKRDDDMYKKSMTFRIDKLRKEGRTEEEISKAERDFKINVLEMKTRIISLLDYNNQKINAYINNEKFEGRLVERDEIFGKTGRFTVTNDNGTDVNKFFILVTYHHSSMKTEEMEGCKEVYCLDALDEGVAKEVLKKGRERVEKLPPFKGKDEKEKKKMFIDLYMLGKIQNKYTQDAVNDAKREIKNLSYKQITADADTIVKRILTIAGIPEKYAE